ncbi:MAG: outer membrane beta-barrel protein [Undibacterium sp.]|nr:outer membrane beta-barrel protein [Opitutaceae bacterium]
MPFSVYQRPIFAVSICVALLTQQASALVKLNDGTDRIYVTGSVGVTQDSNIFASSGGGSDYVYSGGLAVEYTRKAGWIAVNASVGVDISQFDRFRGENFQNPRFAAEFTKQTGRTTGALTLSAQRQSRADAALNTRNTSWNYNAGLNVHYPIIERYSLSGGLGYSLIKYVDNPAFVDLASYSANINLFYILSNERDLFAGYRFRFSNSSRNTQDTDQAFNVGLSGRIIPRVNGTVSVGYQVRTPSDGVGGASYGSTTASAAVSYAFNKKTTLTGKVAKDFSTTASDTSIDVTTAGLDFQYAYSAKITFGANTGYGNNRFLGRGGLIPGTGVHREDTSFDWGARVSYVYSQHLQTNLSYSYMKNWSNAGSSDFERSSWSLGASSRW